jgi:hypothetical protein
MLKLLKKDEYPEWLKEALIRDEIIYLDEEKNTIVWKWGTWEGGNWEGGTWKGGTWEGGTWEGGIWKWGIWKGGTWKGGTWKGGTWEGGTWEGGTWEGGTWKGGTWEGGLKRFVSLIKWPVYYSQKKIIVGCKEFSVDDMIKCREENQFPFEDEFTDDQRKEMKKAIEDVLFILRR